MITFEFKFKIYRKVTLSLTSGREIFANFSAS